LPKVERDNSGYEDAVAPFVVAANTQAWRNALNLLYVNGSGMVLSEISMPVLVSLEGKEEDVTMSLDLMRGKGATVAPSLATAILTMFMPGLKALMQNPALAETGDKAGEEKITQAVFSSFAPVLRHGLDDLGKTLIQSGFTLSDAIAVAVFQTLSTFRQSQIHVMSDQNEYEDVVRLLRRLDVAHPQLQVSVCPNCANFRLIISRHSPHSEKCAQCGSLWTTLTLYTLENSFSKLKVENSDLPVFISAYLRNKLIYLTAMEEISIHPNAVVNIEEGQVEVDAYLPRFKIAVECKVFRDPFGSFSGPHAGSIVGDLRDKIVRLMALGVTDLVIATNLTVEATNKLREELLGDERVKLRLWVLPRDVNGLLGNLDAIADSVGKQVSANFEKSLEGPKAATQTDSNSIEENTRRSIPLKGGDTP
jgi:hypothetical protein